VPKAARGAALEVANGLNVIRKTAPDLVARVNDAMITVDEALAIHRNREGAKQAAREGATHRLEQIMTRICLGDRAPEDVAARLIPIAFL
jgi:hypothetical protein